MAAYYERALELAGAGLAKAVANRMLGEFSAHLKVAGIDAGDSPVGPERLVGLVALVESGDISGTQAKEVFASMLESGEDAAAVVGRLGMRQLSDASAIEEVVDRVLAGNADKVAAYRAGKTGLMGFFVGAVMRESSGQANPSVVNDVLARKLGG